MPLFHYTRSLTLRLRLPAPGTTAEQAAAAKLLAYVLTCSCSESADEKVGTELKKQIMQARLAKKLTQAQLANVSSLALSFCVCRGLSYMVCPSIPVTARARADGCACCLQTINEKPQVIQEYESGKVSVRFSDPSLVPDMLSSYDWEVKMPAAMQYPKVFRAQTAE